MRDDGVPWLTPFAGLLARLPAPDHPAYAETGLRALNALARERALCNRAGKPLRFVDARALDDLPYESRIWRDGEVATRTDEGAWHDFFNALVWLRYPQTKARLNQLQAQAIEQQGVGAVRGSLRDAATVFDENAALVIAPPQARLLAWRDHDWRGLFLGERGREAAGRQWLPLLFGHALLDKLRLPFKGICAHAWLLHDPQLADRLARGEFAAASGVRVLAADSGDGAFAQLDAALAQSLDAGSLRRASFLPLPVLGFPGWWPANASDDFYDDPQVFRPRRAQGTDRITTRRSA